MGNTLTYTGYGAGFVLTGVLTGILVWFGEQGIQSIIQRYSWILPVIFGLAGGAIYLILVGKLLST